MKGKIPKRSDGSFSDSSNSFVRQVGLMLLSKIFGQPQNLW